MGVILVFQNTQNRKLLITSGKKSQFPKERNVIPGEYDLKRTIHNHHDHSVEPVAMKLGG